MMVSDEEKRWLVVGIAMNKVAAPVLRDFIKQGMATHYANLDVYCNHLTAPCTLNTLTYHNVNADPNLQRLKFQNVNNNLHLHGNHKNRYNYSIKNPVDLAKLYLPDYLAQFSAFDESLDMSAIVRLLEFNNPSPIFHSPNPSISIQFSACDVRENVRNKWGHCDVTDWTDLFFNDCFSKLETLVRSLGLTGAMEKTTLDQLSDWKTKGCQLVMGHAVDIDLLLLVRREVKGIIKDSALQSTKLSEFQQTVAAMDDELSSVTARLDEHDTCFHALQENIQGDKETRKEEIGRILERVVSTERTLHEELMRRVQGVEEGLAATNTEVEDLQQRASKTDDRVEQLEQGLTKTDDRVEQLEHEFRNQRMKDVKPGPSPAEPFDVKTCQSKLAEHYKRTATVPTSVWSKASPVDIHQIYTRLAWVKEEQTLAGPSRTELTHYTDVFTAKKKGVAPKRILVQGQTGIGKSTFVKKLSVDWAELVDERMEEEQEGPARELKYDGDTSEDNEEGRRRDDKVTSSEDSKDTSREDDEEMFLSTDDKEDISGYQKSTLKKFELVLIINLKEVSKYKSLGDVISYSNIFPEEDTALMEGLLGYITKNQEKVLLVFDGYDEYRCGRNSEIYEIFRGKKLRTCCVLITTRISKADELREFKDLHAEITGFSERDRWAFMSRMLGGTTGAMELMNHLLNEKLRDLARVPLLLLFFCTLWKKEKLKSFPKSKTKLYLAIVQYVLDHSQGKQSPARFGKVEDFKEILGEIGKVALEGLLNDDHVFEHDQLSAAILCEESVIIGLLQVTEYAENLRPAGMVSFIHKSIQEFLAAWYITCRCVPEGNLGGIEEHACTLKDCLSFANVLQFICGLSDNGAVKVFQHLGWVRISDQLLDFSETMVIPFYTDRDQSFSGMALDALREVQSKDKLVKHWFDCLDGNILVTGVRLDSELLSNVKYLNTLSATLFLFRDLFGPLVILRLHEVVKVFDCLHAPIRLTDNSAVLSIADFLRKFSTVQCKRCGFDCILRFHNSHAQFYLTDLTLCCDDHARLFTETDVTSISSPSASDTCSEQACLKFLRSLHIDGIQDVQAMKDLGLVIKNCKHFKLVRLERCGDSICEVLEQVTNSTCILLIGNMLYGEESPLTSAGAEKLAGVLPRFNNIIHLKLALGGCCAAAINKLVSAINHKSVKWLELSGISLTQPVAAMLGRLLPEMSSVLNLTLIGVDGSTVQTEEMEALFGGFNKTFPSLTSLHLHNFCMRGSLTPLTKRLHFFPNLSFSMLVNLNMDERDLRDLLEGLSSVPNLKTLVLDSNPLGDKKRVRSIVRRVLPQVSFFIDNHLYRPRRTDCLQSTLLQLLVPVPRTKTLLEVTEQHLTLNNRR